MPSAILYASPRWTNTAFSEGQLQKGFRTNQQFEENGMTACHGGGHFHDFGLKSIWTWCYVGLQSIWEVVKIRILRLKHYNQKECAHYYLSSLWKASFCLYVWCPDGYNSSKKEGNHTPLLTFWMGRGKTPSYILGGEKGMELHSHFARKHSTLTIEPDTASCDWAIKDIQMV